MSNRGMTKEKIKVILIDDHSLVRDGIRSLLEGEDDILVIDEAADGLTGIEKILHSDPDIAIIDIRMPYISGIETVQRLKEAGSRVRALILSMHDAEEYVLQSIQAGAMGYLLKDASREEFLKAIRNISKGEKYFSAEISKFVIDKYLESLSSKMNTKPARTDTPADKLLTKRELQILNLVLKGMSNKEIADELVKSIRTIETHRFNLMKKLNAKNSADLAKKAWEYGLTQNN
jgi:DNA-binding NarL/FixJ family response regulator